jgi:RHS repeat-associated protein
VTTNYLVDTLNPTGYAQVVDELVSGAVTRTYAYGLERISENQIISSAWTPSFYGYDGHGSVRQLTNSAGVVTDTYDYDAFGNLIHQTGSTPNNYLFAGEQFDPDLHLYYNRARYLNISTGRFWSMDPKRELPRNPNTLHRYKYASADPINRIDRRGLEDLAELGATQSIGETLDAASVPARGVELIESIGEETSALAQTETETVANAELEAAEEGATAAESQEGEFVEETISNQRAANYQAKITGQPGQAYKLGNVRFDGLAEDGKTLLEAKGPGYARLLKLPFGDSVKSKLVAQALRQVAAAGGRQIVWHFAEDEAANIVIQALKEVGIEAIKVLVTP